MKMWWARITEQDDGWEQTIVDGSVRQTQRFDSAGESLEHILRRSERITATGVQSNMCVITWEPKTRIGRTVVRILTEKAR